MLGAYKARVAPFNVNYRYVAEELRYLLNDAGAEPSSTTRRSPTRLAEVLPDLPALTRAAPGGRRLRHRPAPGRGVVRGRARRRQPRPRPTCNAAPTTSTSSTPAAPPACPRACCGARPTSSSAALGGRNLGTGARVGERRRARGGALATAGRACCPAPPFMHGAGHWLAFNAFTGGNTICIQDDTVGLDADDVWRTIEREKVNILLIVGDAFGRPLVDQLEAVADRGEPYDLSSLLMVVSGGAPLNSTVKDRFLAQLPTGDGDGRGRRVRDRQQMSQMSARRPGRHHRHLHPRSGRGDRQRRPRRPTLDAGHDEIGLARPAGPGAARLPRRRRQDRPHLPGDRRHPLLGARRPSAADRRRHHRALRPRLGHHQLRRREDLRRGGRAGPRPPPRRVRRRVRRAPVRALGPGGRGGRAAPRGRRRPPRTTSSPRRPPTSPATSCPRPSCSATRIVRSPAGKADYRWAKEQVTEPS